MKSEPTRGKGRLAQPSAGEAAVDGLIAGLLAGIAMLLALLGAGFIAQIMPAAVLAHFGAGQANTPAGGALVHLSISGIYGTLFGLMIHWLPMLRRLPGWLAGLVYGSILLFLALGIILPGVATSLRDLPAWLMALGHAVYGLVLGWRVVH